MLITKCYLRSEEGGPDETVVRSPKELQRALRRAIRSVALHLGRVREGLRRDRLAAGGQVSREKVEHWIRAIDETLLDFDDLLGGIPNSELAERISTFLALADEVLDRLEVLGSGAFGPPSEHDLFVH